jgi:hypothetical protein
MPTAVLVSTADAVLNALAGASLSQMIEPRRSYADWELPLEGSSDLQVDVVPVNGPDFELETRHSISYSPQVDIVIRRALGQDEQEEDGSLVLAEIDDLVYLVEQIAEFFVTDRFSEVESIIWQRTQILAAYKASHLRQHRQFTGIIRLTFSATSDL